MSRREQWEAYTEPAVCLWCDGERWIAQPCPLEPDRFVWERCPECGNRVALSPLKRGI